MSNKVVAYIRTSTDDKQDASPDVQIDKIRFYCEKNGLDLVGQYVDYLSGGTELGKRPQLTKLINRVRDERISKVIVLRIDRAFRSVEVKAIVTSVLNKLDCKLIGVDDPVQDDGSANSDFLLTMLTLVAENQRKMTGQMIRDKQAFRVKNGLPAGGDPPFGYKSEKGHHRIGRALYAGWVPDETVYSGRSLADWYKWIISEFRRHGNASEIARHLTDLKVPTPSLVPWLRLSDVEREKRQETHKKRVTSGKKTMPYPPSPIWDASVLSDMLRSKAYLGQVLYKGQWYPGLHEPLLDESVFNDVQVILNSRAIKRQPRKREDVLLTGYLICKKCGRRMTRHEKNEYQRKYVCNLSKNSKQKYCDAKRYNAVAVDDAAFSLLVRGMRKRQSELLDNRILIALQEPDSRDLSAKIAELSRERDKVNFQFRKGYIDEFEYERLIVPLKNELGRLEKEVRQDTTQAKLDDLERIINHIDWVWPRLPMELQREIIRTYVPLGFELEGETLEATVCGNPLAETVKKGGQIARRKKKDLSSQAGEKMTPLTNHDESFSLGGSRSERRDSNPRPPLPQSGALPSCATPRHSFHFPFGEGNVNPR